MKLATVLATSVLALDADFSQWKAAHGKVYKSLAEERSRYSTYLYHKDFVKNHMERYNRGEESYTVALNKFADMTNEEFRKQMNGRWPSELEAPEFQQKYSCKNSYSGYGETAKDSLDLRDDGLVTAVKDQGQCGSCWSFGTAASAEGQVCKQGFKDCTTWSGIAEQAIVSCSSSGDRCIGNYYDSGCNGGWVQNGAKYLECYDPEEEDLYPYVSGRTRRTGTCASNDDWSFGVSGDGCTQVRSSESALKTALSNKGPIGIAIDASHTSFQLYSGGVYDEPRCSSTRLDHAVTLVGYDSSSKGFKNVDYWIVKNSWGKSWGDKGYIWMTMADNQCGVQTDPVIVNVKSSK